MLAVAATALSVAACGAREGPPPADEAPAPPASIADHLRALDRIAGRNGGNRAAGTRGDRETADYVAAQLRAAGYRVRFQDVRFPFFDERTPSRVEGLRRGRDFATARYSPPGTVTARVRSTNTLGCTPQGMRRREIALVRRGTCTFRAKARVAQRAGAAALLIVDPSRDRPLPATLGSPGIRIPVLSLSVSAARRITGDEVDLRVDTVAERRTSRNVIAEPPGGTARVMSGGHLDSAPEGPGMNDNASGIAALLDVARRVEGVSFGFWAAEELGLIGSRRYVREERPELDAYVNLDMVGTPGARLQEYGDPRIRRALAAGRRAGLGGGSDHASFDRAGIPAGGLFTGRDDCYHRRCDDLDNVDRAQVRRAARATARALRRLTSR